MMTPDERAKLVEELAEALAPYTNHKVACILRIEPIIDRHLAAHALDAGRLRDLFYEAITVAHGEGEAFGASRFKNAQCPECARRKEAEDIVAYKREGMVPPKVTQHVVSMVGFGIADRKHLAKEFADRAVAQAHGSTGEGEKA